MLQKRGDSNPRRREYNKRANTYYQKKREKNSTFASTYGRRPWQRRGQFLFSALDLGNSTGGALKFIGALFMAIRSSIKG